MSNSAEQKPEQKPFSLKVSLPAEVVEKYAAKAQGPLEAYLSKAASYLMTVHGEGGLLLKGEHVRDIAAVGGEIKTADDIVSIVKMAAERASRENEDPYRVVIQLDPGLHQPAQETCRMMGYTVEQFLNEMLNTVLVSGMLYSWIPSGLTMIFSESQRQVLEKLAKTKAPTAADVLALLATAMNKKAA